MGSPIWKALIVVCMVPTAGFVFAWSGVYNVAASSGHLALVSKFLQFGMRNSVATYAIGTEVPPLGAADAERGMLYFKSGCAPCHGAPGRSRNPVALAMLPSPPDLTHASDDWSEAQLFRIVKHGIKYTGMPAWPAPGRDDEVWALVAFLRRMPSEVEAYMAGTRMANDENDAVGAIVSEGSIAGPFACASCHGLRGEGSALGGVPKLAGQKAAYIRMALEDYAHAVRPSGMMQPAAVNLDQHQRSALARYYSSIDLENTIRNLADTNSDLRARGAALVEHGAPVRGVPACRSCHGKDGHARENIPQHPALAGQHANYLVNQLQLFRSGRRGGRLSEVMSAIARNLSDDDIAAVSAYYGSLE